MVIVANTYMLNIFKNISLFKLDLGTGLYSPEGKLQIKDPFIIKYSNMTNKHIITYGSIGKLIFYQDFTLKEREMYLFNDDSVYGLKYTDDDKKVKPEEYLADIIKEINDKEGIKKTKFEVDDKPKNPDMKLPSDQYIEQMLKKRRERNG